MTNTITKNAYRMLVLAVMTLLMAVNLSQTAFADNGVGKSWGYERRGDACAKARYEAQEEGPHRHWNFSKCQCHQSSDGLWGCEVQAYH